MSVPAARRRAEIDAGLAGARAALIHLERLLELAVGARGGVCRRARARRPRATARDRTAARERARRGRRDEEALAPPERSWTSSVLASSAAGRGDMAPARALAPLGEQREELLLD